jgi:hypothetical protein
MNFEIFYLKGNLNVLSDGMSKCETMESKDLYTHYKKLFYGEESVNSIKEKGTLKQNSISFETYEFLEGQKMTKTFKLSGIGSKMGRKQKVRQNCR